MQIKSYILVRVTEALNFVSGLHYQIGFLRQCSEYVQFVVSGREASSQHVSTDLPSWHPSFGSSRWWKQSHLTIITWSSCSLLRCRPFPAAGSQEVPCHSLCGCQPWRQQESRFWHLQASPHKYTEKTDQTFCRAGHHNFCQVTKVILAKSSRVKLRLNILISILKDKPGILLPIKGLLVIFF